VHCAVTVLTTICLGLVAEDIVVGSEFKVIGLTHVGASIDDVLAAGQNLLQNLLHDYFIIMQ